MAGEAAKREGEGLFAGCDRAEGILCLLDLLGMISSVI